MTCRPGSDGPLLCRLHQPTPAIQQRAAVHLFATAGWNRCIAAGRDARLTNPERVIAPTTGLKKIDLVRYYESIADWILPHLKGRRASLVRTPDGVAGKLFFQKQDESKLLGLTQLSADLWPGHDALLSVDSAQALLSAAQMNVVEFHTWNSLEKNINKLDRVIFDLDLDPGEGATWENLQEAAALMRTLLTELGLQAWLKTSGGKGLHVVVPQTPRLDYETVKNFSQAAVRHMAKVIRSRFVAGGGNRVGKIFIDYLCNDHAQTTAAAFSARLCPGLGVSMPIAWDQLSSVKSGTQWTIATAREYVSFQQTDPWADYWKAMQSLTVGLKALDVAAKATNAA